MSSSEKSDSLRERAKEYLNSVTDHDVQLIWILGEIHGTKRFRDWGYSSFRDWYEEEGSGTPSLSHAYALARIGKIFLGQKEAISAKIKAGDLTVRQLMDLASKYNQGEPIEDVVHDAVGKDGPERVPDNPHARDPERPREIRVYVPAGDLSHVLCGLTLEALANGVNTLSASIVSRGIETWDNLLQGRLDLKKYDKYREYILDGKFFCAACNRIPLEPTFHHVLPVSVGRGYGPQALLCWEPCHEQVVQPQWRKWADRWGKKYGFTVAALKEEAERQINSGIVDTKPTVRIFGKPHGVGN